MSMFLQPHTLLTALLGAAIVAGSAAPAKAQTQTSPTHGHIMMQLKTPKTGCKFISLDLLDSSGKTYTPNGNTTFLSEIEKKQIKNKFTDIHKFHVKPGSYTLKNIRCTTGGKTLAFPIQFSPTSPRLLPKSIRTMGHRFNIKAGKDIYIGALDFIRYNPENSWPLALDKSQIAIDKGQLKDGEFTKQFLTMDIDFDAIRPSENTSSFSYAEGGPPSKGKGELAVQYDSSYACHKVNIRFKNANDPDGKGIRIKIKNISQKDGSGFGSKKVTAGRYVFSSASCELHNRTLGARALARSYVDVYPDEISYAGEIKQVSVDAFSLTKAAKYKFEFSSKIEAAKKLVDRPERLVDRSATMRDRAQLAISGIENALNRLNTQWNKIAADYKARIEEYDDDIIPGYQE